jgi:GNAT superfamily N-acetyltransferase
MPEADLTERARAGTIRLVRDGDALTLFQIRRLAILALAPPLIAVDRAQAWAATHPPEWMNQFLRKRAVWVFECGGEIAGWIGLNGNIVDGLYTSPGWACCGVGSRLLQFVEGELARQGTLQIDLEASRNAEEFYLKRGYRAVGPRPTEHDALPMSKVLPQCQEPTTT